MQPSNYIKGGVAALLVAGLAGYLATRSHEKETQASGESAGSSPGSVSPQLSADSAASSDQDGVRLPSRKADRSADGVTKLELGIARLEQQMKDLNTREGLEKIPYAADLPFPNNPVKPLYDQYGEEKMKMMSLKESGMGPKHPSSLAQQKTMDSMSLDLVAAVDRLNAQMETELNADREALLRLRSKP